MMEAHSLFKYSSQVKDISGHQALSSRTGLIFGVWMSGRLLWL